MLKNLKIQDGHWVVNGEKKSCWVGRDAFKLLMWVAQGYYYKTERYIERCQTLLGENTILRVFGETVGWEAGNHPMFGSYPKDPGIWDIEDIRERIRRDDRPIKRLTSLNQAVLEWLCEQSHTTGVAFEYNPIATLKHTRGPGAPHGDWLTTGVGDHAIRQTSAYLRELVSAPGAPYPDAKIIVNSCNEWGAHNKWRMTVEKVNKWSDRFYRWARFIGDGTKKEYRIQCLPPGPNWVAEQWPEGFITVDGTTGYDIHIGGAAGFMKMALEHPERDRPRWWELPDTYDELRSDARGMPFGYNESIMIGDAHDEDRLREWYGARGWTTDLDHYMEWLGNCQEAVRYFIIHDEAGMQADGDAPESDLERELGGWEPPNKVRTFFRPVSILYRDILGRRMNSDGTYGDPGGLASKEAKMQQMLAQGWTVISALAVIAEEMYSSQEYLNKNHKFE